MTKNTDQIKRKNMIKILESITPSQERNLTREELMDKAKKLTAIEEYSGDLHSIVDDIMTRRDIHMSMGVSIVAKAEHDQEWVRRLTGDEWHYHKAYQQYLIDRGWPLGVTRSVTLMNREILGHLQDPNSKGNWDKRGLVIGHIQSGKTANYIGLMAAAADAGYKFIVVIAGIHSNLRKQTQERVDEGFVGMTRSHDGTLATIGVGKKSDYRYPVSFTHSGTDGDFDKNIAASSVLGLNDSSKPVTLVIKKNVTVLRTLLNWLKDMNDRQGIGTVNVPMLLIDDEADHASINTSREARKPTKTNSLIRQILAIFGKSCYVGYTATPFANIFINPDAYDDEVREDLFPRDFIYSLPISSNYFGPDDVFPEEEDGNENSVSGILRPIVDCENFIPLSHKRGHHICDLPPSLRRATCQFVIARAIYNLRGHSDQHCSMMIHVSRFVRIQKIVAEFVRDYVAKLQGAVELYHKMPGGAYDKNEYMFSLKGAFDEEYNSICEYGWVQVKSALNEVLQELRVFVVNSKSDDILDYTRYEKEGGSLTAIAIGGLSLSRGLTIKGLCISYMYRNTRIYDTLMQMARWFGYPEDYRDLCRVHLSEDSIDWYGFIFRATEELRDQIRVMRLDNRTPEDFGLCVRRHPESLLITAQGKMRSGQIVPVKQALSGRIKESYILPVDEELNQRNEYLIKEYWLSGFGATVQENNKGWQVLDAPVDEIGSFLRRFEVVRDWGFERDATVSYLEKISDIYPKADVLLISRKENKENGSEYRLGFQVRRGVDMNSEGRYLRLSKNRVASRGDEKHGLSLLQKEAAKKQSRDDAEKEPKDTKKTKQISDLYYRRQRNKPLLMIHFLKVELSSEARWLECPAFGISFPELPEGKDVEISVLANQRYMEFMRGSDDNLDYHYDDDDDDDDDEI